MLVALNLLYLIPGVVGGTETYARSLIHALADEDRENEYTVYLCREAADLDVTPGPNFRRVVCPVPAMQRVMRYAWEQGVLPLQLLREKPALVHSLGYVSPLAARCPQVVTVHDVNYLGHKGRRTAVGRRVFQFFVEQTVKRADRIIAVSEFSRGEIVKHLHVPPEKVTAVHSAGREGAECTVELSRRPESMSNLPRPYILAFSSLSGHKNIPGLISAFASISASVPHSLVLVGHLPEKSAIRSELQSAGDRVHFTGYVPDEDIGAFMQQASLFAFPSFYEGFGLPILDAQNAGVPVACSSAGALPEIAGEGAMLFDPESVTDMAGALKRCLADTSLRDTLVEKGYANARRFSWQRTARQTLSVYESVAS